MLLQSWAISPNCPLKEVQFLALACWLNFFKGVICPDKKEKCKQMQNAD